ncbi:MAG: cytochrome c biogenesis CcdA family protein [Pseudomonadales bacterium]
MSLALSSIPLAWAAGVLSILSPCVWPLVPAVMSASTVAGRAGAWYLGLGLSLSFAAAGTLLAFLLLNLAVDPQALRYVAAAMLLLIAMLLLVKSWGEWVAGRLSRLTSRFDTGSFNASRPSGQFAVGALLGLVWLPCIGPTLGAAVALASLGQQMGMAFVVMLAFGIGTASVLLLAGFTSTRVLSRWRPGILSRAERGKKLLGYTLLLLSLLVFTGLDKVLEALALQLLPAWAISM